MRFFQKYVALAGLMASLIGCNDENAKPSFSLSILEISDSGRALNWDEVENADGYRIWRSVKRDGVLHDAVMIASLNFLTLSYVDEDVPENQLQPPLG